ncbi:GDSL-like Lipase/Acylhydrolase [Trichoderma harzianum]|uniref:GDSL-like Lipase/Acylhydrolase n=1 Tax=Trichoderma harzianum TaxID=5544 RepID=A0A0F9WZ02_TRIHA|nr:GDSL-like Lipase/Acylhydrolase [Trichoderma harzianum]
MKFSYLSVVYTLITTAWCLDNSHWVDIWNESPLLSRFTFITPQGYFRNATIRQTLHLTLATGVLRVKLSNEFGSSPLEITASTAALTANNTAGSDSVDASSLQELTYSGASSIVIPAGGFGDQTANQHINGGSSVTHWYYVTEVQGQLPATSSALICIGDSITDGTGSTTNGNDRWVDDLFRRTQAAPATKNIAVLNAGIGGNHLVTSPGQGPSALERIKSIIAQPGVRLLAILDGVNDIGHVAKTAAAQDALYDQMVQALEEIIDEVHQAGLPIFGGTLTPSFYDPPSNPNTSNYADPQRAATRNRLNLWIKNEAKFDYVVDYAAALADPGNPDSYKAQYAFTNYIHPNVAGHQAMADAWDLRVFQQFNGTSS